MQDFAEPITIITLIGFLLFYFLVDWTYYRATKKWAIEAPLISAQLLAILFWLFKLDYLFYLLLTVELFIMLVTLFFRMKEFRGLFVDGKFAKKLSKNIKGEIIYNREEVVKLVSTAAITLSKQKIGALITLQKKDNLDDFITTGTTLNAPVGTELLQTIFYPGTRLHDGAVVIRGDKIVAASVYYTPTTKTLTGKYGSRHRAALGISENTDSVTIVVSEETGRISLAIEGELESVSQESLSNRLTDALK